MPLSGHLRELRSRLTKSFLAIGAGAVVGWLAYGRVFAWLREPFDAYRRTAVAHGHTVELTLTGITSAFSLKLDVALFVGVVLAAPVWIYQLWSFLSPGLHRNERRYAVGFVAAATPLFLLGLTLGYLIVPKSVAILLGLTPHGVANLPTVGQYLSFVLRLCLAFGVAFLVPVVVVGLNFAGVLSSARLRSWWRGAVLVVFVFAAIITPTPDAVTMTLLALPMLALLAVAWAVAWWHDRRVARRVAADLTEETSPIEPPTPIHDSQEPSMRPTTPDDAAHDDAAHDAAAHHDAARINFADVNAEAAWTTDGVLGALSRRAILVKSSLGLAAAGALTMMPALPALTSTAASEAPEVDSIAPESASLDAPLIAHVKDLQSGEMSLYAGEREVVVRDPALAARLFNVAK